VKTLDCFAEALKNLSNLNLDYIIKKSHKAKRVSLKITSSGKLIAIIPYTYKTDLPIKKFIAEKKDWILKHLKPAYKFKNTTLDKNLLHKNFLKNKQLILQDIKTLVDYYAKFYNISYKKITIKNQSTIWGSCSKSKNLNFNFRIAYLPTQLKNYIIIHEVCHTLEMNHSKKYWSFVYQTTPNYKLYIKQLRKYEKNFFIT